MGNPEKKTNRYGVLTVYLIALVCLLMGLFLPLYNGKGILALCLPDIINRVANSVIISSDKTIDFAYQINLFGLHIDAGAYVMLLFFIVTFLALIALIPLAIQVAKDKKKNCVLEYIVLVATAFIISAYVLIALQLDTGVSYNMVIAYGGVVFALVVLGFMNKGKTGVTKFFLFLLSALAVLTLFDYAVVIPSLADGLNGLGDKINMYPSFYFVDEDVFYPAISMVPLVGGNMSGTEFIASLLGLNSFTFGETISWLAEAKYKAAFVLGTITALVAVFNYFTDLTALTTNAKKCGLLFNIVRYGLEFASAVCLIITVLVCKYGMGLFLVLLAALALIRLAISIVRFILYLKRKKEEESDAADDAQTLHFAKPTKAPKAYAAKPEPAAEEIPEEKPSVPEFAGAEPITVENAVPVPEEEQPEQMAFIEDAKLAPPPAEEETVEIKENPDEVQMEIAAVEQVQPAIVEPLKPLEPLKADPVKPLEPLEPLEPLQPLKPLEPLRPAESELKPLEPLQPLEPLRPDGEVAEKHEPAQSEPERSEIFAPVHAEPVAEVKPAEEVKPEPAPAPVEERKPEPAPAPERVYTPVYDSDNGVYNLRYGGPYDAFISKLTNDEKIEFAMTFIERNKGDVSNLPEYIIGGDNRKFFNSVFIYLGRLRGLISDGLLNKMFKELNMM